MTRMKIAALGAALAAAGAVVRLKAPQSGRVIRGRTSTGYPVWTFTAN